MILVNNVTFITKTKVIDSFSEITGWGLENDFNLFFSEIIPGKRTEL
jgi:hypothetical protein